MPAFIRLLKRMGMGKRIRMERMRETVRRNDIYWWLERFLREAKVVARLEHPNIVPVHELANRLKAWIKFFIML